MKRAKSNSFVARRERSPRWSLLRGRHLQSAWLKKFVRAAAFDVTARNRLLRENERLAQAAEKANRTKDEFIALLSHELRTPLTPVMGWLGILRGGKIDDEKRAHALAVIDRSVKSQIRLVDDLLDVSRIISGKLVIEQEVVDFAQIVEEVIDSEKTAAASRGIELVCAIQHKPCSIVAGHTERIRQVVGNIVGNALKFTPEKGRVTVMLTRVGDNAMLEIRDTGIGISAENLTCIFERFRQGSAGLGLGLNIASNLIRAHGGRIDASSPGENMGATFKIQLPLSDILPSDVADLKNRTTIHRWLA